MRLFNKYMLLALAIMASAQGCDKEPIGAKDTGAPIMLSASEAGTKALLDNEAFKTTGNRIQVYDFVNDGTTTKKHIDAYAGPDVDSNSPLHTYGTTWPFEDKTTGEPTTYQWIPGTHKFFGWLAKDATLNNTTPESFFGEGFGFSETNMTLSIPVKEMTNTTPQFDFLYSNVVTTVPQNDPVQLTFNHLFTALSIGLENSTSSYIRILDFKLENIPSTKSATINFSETATSVNYSNFKIREGTESELVVFTRGLDNLTDDYYTVSPNSSRNNIFNGSLQTNRDFMMLWPINASLLFSEDKIEIKDGVTIYPPSWKMYIEYAIGDGNIFGDPIVKRVNFPNISLEAGKKYNYDIVFADKSVKLKVNVNPWEYEEQSINYAEEFPSISDGGKLVWDNTVSSVNDQDKMVFIVNAQSAKAQFTLQSPVGGSWIVSLVGDLNAFEVSPSTGVIDTQTATIYVKPLVAAPTRDYKVQLKFTVRRSDGRMIAADDIIQRGGIYSIVLPRNN